MYRFTGLMLFVFMLAGCGGGGGGSRPMDGMSPGGGTTGLTPAQVREAIGDIGLAADRLFMTDLLATPGSRVFPNVRADVSCARTSCTARTSAVELTSTTGGLSDLSGATISGLTETQGVNMGQVRGRSTVDTITTDYHVYGGWLESNFFGVIRVDWSGTFQEQRLNGLETLTAFSTGDASGSNPMSGSATWTGLMIGAARTAPTNAITGQTEAVYSFADQTMDIDMTQLTRGHADMSWENLRVSGGSFGTGTDANSISGTFYGSAHEELGGVFERNGIVGAFGAARQ